MDLRTKAEASSLNFHGISLERPSYVEKNASSRLD